MLVQSDRNKVTVMVMFVLFVAAVASAALAIWSLKFKWAFIATLGLLFPFLLALVREKRLVLTALMIYLLPLRIDYRFLWGKTYSLCGASAITIGAFEILFLILLADWLIGATRAKNSGAIRFFPMFSVPTLLLILAGAVSLFWARDRWLTLFDLVDFIKAWLFFLFLANTIRTKRALYWVLAASLAGVITQSVLFILQYYYNISLAFLAIGDPQSAPDMIFRGRNLDIFRPDGTIGHVNSYARYLLMFLPLALSMVLTLRDRTLKWFSGIALGLGFTTLIISLTRSAWVSFIFAVVVVFTYLFFKRLLTLRAIRNTFIAAVIAVLVLFAFQDLLIERIVSDDNGAARSRVVTSIVAWRVIQQHPLQGVGLNNYGQHLAENWLYTDPYTRVAAVHNNYLLFWAEMGLIGLACLLAFFIAFYLRTRQACNSRYAFIRIVAIGLMGAFVAMIVSSFFDYYKGNTILVSGIWGLAGLTEALNAMSERYNENFSELLHKRPLKIEPVESTLLP